MEDSRMAEQGYAFAHQGAVFTPEGRVSLPGSVEAHNRELEARELASWAEGPERALGYFVFPDEQIKAAIKYPRCEGATVTTWLGTVIGRITSANIYRHNFGARFVSLRVLGTNGAEYWGRASWDGGNAVILRKVRGVK